MNSIFSPFGSKPKIPYDPTAPVKHPLTENKIPVKDPTYWFKLTKKRLFNDWHTLNDPQVRVLLSLWLFKGSKASCYPSLSKLCLELKKDRKNVIRILAQLQDLGYIRIEKTAGKPNRYFPLR